MDISGYLEDIRAKYASGQATEHSYRPALQKLFATIDPALTVINEPKKSEAGMPDFLFQRGHIPFGWAEAKDIDKDVIKLKGYSIEQRKRYEKAYPNLIYTNGVDFEFIREGESVHFVSIADFLMGLQPKPENFDELERHLKLFAEQKPISTRSAAKLAEMMAAKAEIIKEEIEIALKEDPEFRSALGGQFKSFQANLLPHLTPDEFADLYAETITYGMFAARLHDTDLNTFSRQEAMEDLPASNPFLKGLFQYIAGPSLPKRLEYIVDDLVQVMRASDPHSLFKDFGKFTARNDPFIHFYEDFLAAYNPAKRKSRGVWYTPEPVVDFIVRAVDDVLRTEFGLADGLADTSKVTVDWDMGRDHPKTRKPITEKRELHKVQILDPAAGTGTFLAKVAQTIADRVKARAPGKWSAYVEEDLLPRLHGFELLMASYAMCHMKLDMMLDQTGYKPSTHPPRLSVWLTNSLEPPERDVKDLFFQPLAEEARGASEVKRQSPIMCVIGNPPYNVASENMGEWIRNLISPYKQGLNETKINLDEDYVIFIRFGEQLIEKNGKGVLAFITNNSYLRGVTHRNMRKHLMSTFDKIVVLNLHGDSNQKEKTPDGTPDSNVFDIRQGVSICILRKTCASHSGDMARVSHAHAYGSREAKNELLFSLNIIDNKFKKILLHEPYYLFDDASMSGNKAYEEGFKVTELFENYNTGIQTKRDALCLQPNDANLRKIFSDIRDLETEQFRSAYGLVDDNRDWSIEWARADLLNNAPAVVSVLHRPFDVKRTYYTGHSKGFLGYPRDSTMRNMLDGRNIALLCGRQNKGRDNSDYLVSEYPSEMKCAERTIQSYHLPLYVYVGGKLVAGGPRANFEPKLYAAICKAAGIDPTDKASPDDDFRAATGDARPSEVKVFDYIYGVLHSPAYREKFAEFLKIDFPRIPFAPSPEVFREVSEKGERLRRLHLMEPAAIGETPYPYKGEGDDVVASSYPKFEVGRVQINKDQYFDGVPKLAWELNIGGYQPAQKWLKDRRGRTLSFDDVTHYQKIVKILVETDQIMKEIELPLG